MGIEGIEAVTQDQTPYKGDEKTAYQQAKFPTPERPDPIAPLDKEYLDSQEKAEAAKQSELDKARELHNRVTAGEDHADVKAELGL